MDWISFALGAGAFLGALLLLAVILAIVEARNANRYARQHGWERRDSSEYYKRWDSGSVVVRADNSRGACSIRTTRWEPVDLAGFANQLEAMKFADWCMNSLPASGQLTEEVLVAARATWSIEKSSKLPARQ